MNIEHYGFFHGFTKAGAPKTQKPCARLPDADRENVADAAASDPAMVLMFRMASILPMVRASYPLRPVAGLRLDTPRGRFQSPRVKTRARCACELYSTTNIMLFEQRLIARLVLPLDVIKKGTACGDHFQKPTTRMIVLHVGFEMPGEVVDAFRQDRDLNLGRAGVTGLVGIRLDDFRFTFGGNRHRQTLSLLRAGLAVSPVRLNTRLGMSSPLPISARARSRPATVT